MVVTRPLVVTRPWTSFDQWPVLTTGREGDSRRRRGRNGWWWLCLQGVRTCVVVRGVRALGRGAAAT